MSEQDCENMSQEAKVTKDGESSSTSSSMGKSGSREGYSADCSASDVASDQSSDENGDRKVGLGLGALSLKKETEDPAEYGRRQSLGFEDDSESEDDKKRGVPMEAVSNELKNYMIHKEAPNQTGYIPIFKSNNIPSEGWHKSPLEVAIEELARRKEEAAAAADFLRLNGLRPPQHNGAVITHHMDPRIDLSKVYRTTSGFSPDFSMDDRPLSVNLEDKQSDLQEEQPFIPTVENYVRVMQMSRNLNICLNFFSFNKILCFSFQLQAVRPFFSSSVSKLSQNYQQALKEGELEDNCHQSDKNASTESEGFTSFFTTTDSNETKQNSHVSGDSRSPEENDKHRRLAESSPVNNSAKEQSECDASSMKVLARTKRKHKHLAEESSTYTSSLTSSAQKRVRIQEAHQHVDRHIAAGEQNEMANAPTVPPRVVTDVSSSARTNTTTSGSGSGSGGNSGSNGSGNDGKGSSEEAKEDISGDATNDGSTSDEKKLGIGLTCGPVRHNSVAAVHEFAKVGEKDSSREQKLLDKRRKRLEMRREYEAQQLFESSESSDSTAEQYLKPGKPVTMDAVLVFSKIPRIVVQSEPPFLVVHTNAAYCRLTGIDAHVVVGRPVSALVALRSETDTVKQLEEQHHPGQAENVGGVAAASEDLIAAAESERFRVEATLLRGHKEMSLERLIATSGLGHLHLVYVSTNSNHMVGRNVTVFSSTLVSGQASDGRREEDSNNTSISSSYEGEKPPILCWICIAPIVSSSKLLHVTANRDSESPHQREKRTKHYHGASGPSLQGFDAADAPSQKKYLPLQHVSHFVIQLLPSVQDAAINENGMESLSSNSTSVEAQLLGLSKEELHKQRAVLAPPEAASEEGGDDMAVDQDASSGMSDSRDAMAAVA